jgi:hypothetical protein
MAGSPGTPIIASRSRAWSAGMPARPASASRSCRAASQIAPAAPIVVDDPKVGPASASAVSPWRTSILAVAMPSASAAICASTVAEPVPIS